ncbi:MAG: hypothetical protein EXR99_01725 [Gemmataceae bacterium]|nr:hypothetical protein [Gemmataceae bacterium]
MQIPLCLFEDPAVMEFGPLVQTRPFFNLLCGAFPLIEKIQKRLACPVAAAWVRPELENLVARDFPSLQVNQISWKDHPLWLLVNSRWLPPRSWAPPVQPQIGLLKGSVVYLVAQPQQISHLENPCFPTGMKFSDSLLKEQAPGELLQYPWDLVEKNGLEISEDAKEFDPPPMAPGKYQIQGNPRNLLLFPGASVEPYVFFDCTSGPIIIEPGVKIKAFSRIDGPCFIGQGTHLDGCKIKGGASIGRHCRVGGEIENSILHGFTNKYHEGFLGHSVIGEWVNFGAGTNNSDLRIDYKPVKVQMETGLVDSGKLKVGCFCGDHTKTAIGVQINTGSNIGAFCQLLPGGLLPRFIPSFSMVDGQNISLRQDLPGILRSAAIAMGRRGVGCDEARVGNYSRLFDQALKNCGKSSPAAGFFLRRQSA